MVTITTKSGKTVQARYVIVATPPHLTANIEFSPPLPYSKQRLCQLMPVGHIIKVLATYKEVCLILLLILKNNFRIIKVFLIGYSLLCRWLQEFD